MQIIVGAVTFERFSHESFGFCNEAFLLHGRV
jgi:hypothetical protein